MLHTLSMAEDILALYAYHFPAELIAQAPASPRDSARLLVYSRSSSGMSWDIFRSVGKYLPERALLVINETKVVPARLNMKRENGASCELLCTDWTANEVRAMADRTLKVGERLSLRSGIAFTVLGNVGREWVLTASQPLENFERILDRSGITPLPSYIKHCPLSEEERRREYQSVFARVAGSIAAPTASLHFTEELLQQLQQQEIEIARLTLHVNLGTFAPVTGEQLRAGLLHREQYEIDVKAAQQLVNAKNAGRPVIAVGTTVVRTLESAFGQDSQIQSLSGETSLFIREGYPFKVVDGLVTNFHVPKSSLLMLVSALIGREKLFELYEQAIERKFRLFSFGDAMLIV